MLDVSPIPISPRAKHHYAHVFAPKFESLRQAVSQVPLVILIWGPGSSAKPLYEMQLALRDELKQSGHAVFLGEELKSTLVTSTPFQGLSMLPSRDVDLIIALQPSYGVIASEQAFLDQSIIDAKVLVFVDQSAPDGYAYRHAVAELKTLYDNVETYRFTEDIIQRGLIERVTAHVERLRWVKYRALTGAESWDLLTALEETF